jgi:hypothetical protein
MVERLERRTVEEGARRAGLLPLPGEADARCTHFRRGWYWGRQDFAERMMKLAQTTLRHTKSRAYCGVALRQAHGLERAERWLKEGLAAAGSSGEELLATRGSDPRKVALAQPNQIIELGFLFLRYCGGDAVHDVDLQLQFPRVTDERNHDLGPDFLALLLHFGHGFKDRPRLYLGNLGINNAEPATAMAKHRIELVQLIDAARDVLHRNPDFARVVELLLSFVREKFVQRRIEKTNRRRQAIEGFKDAGEISPLRESVNSCLKRRL